MGDFVGAKRECSKALGLDTTLNDVQFTFGKVLEAAGDTASAIIHYKLFLQADSTSEDASAAKKRIDTLTNSH